MASKYDFISWRFCLFYAIGLLFMFIYALLWQRVLKELELSVAYANRPIVTLLSMLWGKLFFDEVITWNMLLGAAIIMLGIGIVGKADEL